MQRGSQDQVGNETFALALAAITDDHMINKATQEEPHVVITNAELANNRNLGRVLEEAILHVLSAVQLWSRIRCEEMVLGIKSWF